MDLEFIKGLADRLTNKPICENRLKELFDSTIKKLPIKTLQERLLQNAESNFNIFLRHYKILKSLKIQQNIMKFQDCDEALTEMTTGLIQKCKTNEQFDDLRKILINSTIRLNLIVNAFPAFLCLFESHIEHITNSVSNTQQISKFSQDFFNTMLIMSEEIPVGCGKDSTKKMKDVLCALFSLYVEFKLQTCEQIEHDLKLFNKASVLLKDDVAMLLDSLAQVACDECNKTTARNNLKSLHRKLLVATKWKNESPDVYLKVCLASKLALTLHGGVDNYFCSQINGNILKMNPPKNLFDKFGQTEEGRNLVANLKLVAHDRLTGHLLIQSDVESIQDLLQYYLTKKEEPVSVITPQEEDMKDDIMMMIDTMRPPETDDEEDEEEMEEDYEGRLHDLIAEEFSDSSDDDTGGTDFIGFSPPAKYSGKQRVKSNDSDEEEESQEAETSQEVVDSEENDSDSDEMIESKEEVCVVKDVSADEEVEIEESNDEKMEIEQVQSQKQVEEDQKEHVEKEETEKEQIEEVQVEKEQIEKEQVEKKQIEKEQTEKEQVEEEQVEEEQKEKEQVKKAQVEKQDDNSDELQDKEDVIKEEILQQICGELKRDESLEDSNSQKEEEFVIKSRFARKKSDIDQMDESVEKSQQIATKPDLKEESKDCKPTDRSNTPPPAEAPPSGRSKTPPPQPSTPSRRQRRAPNTVTAVRYMTRSQRKKAN